MSYNHRRFSTLPNKADIVLDITSNNATPSTLKRFSVPLLWSLSAHAALFLAIGTSWLNTPSSPSHTLHIELKTPTNHEIITPNPTKAITDNNIPHNKTLRQPTETNVPAVRQVESNTAVVNAVTVGQANITSEIALNHHTTNTDNTTNTVETSHLNPHTEQPTLAIESPIFDAAFLKNPQPSYPIFAKKRQQEGTVKLKVKVSTEGKAEVVELAESSGFSLLDDAAQQAVEKWQFVPARRGDLVIVASVIVPIRFALR